MSMEPREVIQTVAEEHANQEFPEGCQCDDSSDEICDWCAERDEYLTDVFHRRYRGK